VTSDASHFATVNLDAFPAVQLALPLTRFFEGCRLQAYPDPGTGGDPWTIGWGCTTFPNGRPVGRGDTISQPVADVLLESGLVWCWWTLGCLVPGWSRLKTHQQAALLSFSWNVGTYWYSTSGFSTLSRMLAAGNYDAVPGALLLYCNPGTAVERGLKARRSAEAELWKGNGWKRP